MRSLAAVYDWLGAGRPEPEEEKQQRPEPPDYRLRALPREDIHLYVKPIDNTNVVRVVDKKDWMANIWVAGSALLCSLMSARWWDRRATDCWPAGAWNTCAKSIRGCRRRCTS